MNSANKPSHQTLMNDYLKKLNNLFNNSKKLIIDKKKIQYKKVFQKMNK